MKPCAPFPGCKNASGYGVRRIKGKNYLAHRVAYAEAHGLRMPDIVGVIVRHTCDNPPCCEPEHLIDGTHADNVQDKVDRGRQQKGVDVHCAKLDAALVDVIRKRYVPYCKVNGSAALAREFGVSQTAVSRIVRQTAWRHV